MGEGSCCCCFDLKTGVWIIGLIQVFQACFNLVTTFRTGGWYEISVQLAIEIVFSVIFLLHMTSHHRQSYGWRNFIFWYYFIFIVIASAVYGYLTGFGYIWDVVGDVCSDPDIS